MIIFNIDTVLQELSKNRPVFHNEADFQFALAWEIQRQYPDFNIRLEYKVVEHTKRYIDIWIRNENIIAIELKYKSSSLKTQINDEVFDLSNHGAADLGRYDFWKDVQRVEEITAKYHNAEGYVIMITNDPSYWKLSQYSNSIDSAFKMYEGRKVTGKLSWSSKAGGGTTKDREKPITIKRMYDINWKRYSVQTNNEFKILCLKIASVYE